MKRTLSRSIYQGGDRLDGPLLYIQGAQDAVYGEVGQITAPDGSSRMGRVLEVGQDMTVVELWGESRGLSPGELTIEFRGRPFEVPVSREMLGRVFDGLGRPLDGLPVPLPEDRVDVHGVPLNPSARAYPREIIETGISTLDGLNTLVRGQKLPIFSGSGLPHHQLAAQIARQARAKGGEEFAIIFAALGVGYDTSQEFRSSLEESGAMSRSALFLNHADDPAIERTITPRVALSLAEHLAFEHEMHILVILTDMTNYGEALRELSARREEVPTRKGFPGYLYTDLASIYERCGRARGREGSITMMPVVTMPNDDITHPIPDLTGYITEGQIVLGRDLDNQGIYPPVSVLSSLSRLMKDAVGEGLTRGDHSSLANQLYGSYTRVQEVRDLADIIGEDELSDSNQQYLKFGEAFEKNFISQGEYNRRDIEDTLDLGWMVLKHVPRQDLTRISTEEIDQHLPGENDG